MIEKFFPLLLLLLPILVKAQNTQDQYFCISRTTHVPFTAVSGQTYRNLLIDVGGANSPGITIPNGGHDIHITGCFVTNSHSANGAIFVQGNTNNISIDTSFISNSYIGVNAGGTGSPQSGNNLHIYYNRIYNIQDVAGHSNSKGSYVQFNNYNGAGNKIMYNDCYNPTDLPAAGDGLSIYQSNGTADSPIQVNYNDIVNGSSDPGGFMSIVLGDVGGSYQEALYNKAKNTGYGGYQIQGGTFINLSFNQAYGSKRAVSLLGLTSANYSGKPTGNLTAQQNKLNWTNWDGSIVNKYLNPGVLVPTGWNTNSPDKVPDPNVNADLLPDVLFNPTCTVPPVQTPVLSYNGSPFTFTAGTTIGQLNIINSGGAVTSGYTVSPLLPSGLTLNSSTGSIQGTPILASAATIYTITGSNTAGAGKAVISITVKAAPVAVPAFTYSPNTNSYNVGIAIAPKGPISTGGAVISYSISPALSTGLSFNTANGVISGTPTITSPATVYTISGVNSSGTGKTTVTLTVAGNPVIAPNISYTPSTLNTTYGAAINWVATNTGSPATFTISPALPFGLGMIVSTGNIIGTPAAIQGATSYVVTATNASGSSHFTITLSVTKASLTITAINQQKYQGSVNPDFTYGVSGLVSNDSPVTALQTPPVLSTTADVNSPVGSYPIIPSAGVSANYNLVYVNGTLQVLAPTTLIIFKTFGGIKQ